MKAFSGNLCIITCLSEVCSPHSLFSALSAVTFYTDRCLPEHSHISGRYHTSAWFKSWKHLEDDRRKWRHAYARIFALWQQKGQKICLFGVFCDERYRRNISSIQWTFTKDCTDLLRVQYTCCAWSESVCKELGCNHYQTPTWRISGLFAESSSDLNKPECRGETRHFQHHPIKLLLKKSGVFMIFFSVVV